jgi:hypothetical protein
MSAVAQQEGVRFDPVEHRYFRGLQELASVTKVIRETWPIKPSWDGVDMAVVENARDRGIEVDLLFCSWLSGTLTAIPLGTRTDALDRFAALRTWWNKFKVTSVPNTQLILADDEIAGTCDLAVNVNGLPWIFDLKNTSQLETTHSIQLGAYGELYRAQYGVLPAGLGVIHVTQPKDKPASVKVFEYEVGTALSDWQLVRQMWNLVRRKGKK